MAMSHREVAVVGRDTVLYATAHWHGTCPDCEQPIRPGQLISKTIADSDEWWFNLRAHVEPRWGHDQCPYVEADLPDITVPAKTPLCERCWTYHRGECL